MSLITLDSIHVKNNPAMFSQPIAFEVTFTALCTITEPIQWKVLYVGSAKTQQHDQILEEFEIGPFDEPSTMKFQIECPAPDASKIPYDQLLCVTALILTVSYKDSQFIRVGYYVHYQFLGEEETDSNNYPILPILIASTRRTIISDKPRITNFNIDWSSAYKKQQELKDNDKKEESYINKQEEIKKNQNQQNHIVDKFSTESHSFHDNLIEQE